VSRVLNLNETDPDNILYFPTFSEVAREMGLTRECVRAKFYTALKKAHIAEDGSRINKKTEAAV
jgi:hypothetical protein